MRSFFAGGSHQQRGGSPVSGAGVVAGQSRDNGGAEEYANVIQSVQQAHAQANEGRAFGQLRRKDEHGGHDHATGDNTCGQSVKDVGHGRESQVRHEEADNRAEGRTDDGHSEGLAGLTDHDTGDNTGGDTNK